MPSVPVTPKTMPVEKYVPFRPLPLRLENREWPNVEITKAPMWVSTETPEKATIIVVLCDTSWTEDCDGSAEEVWLAQSKLGGLLKIDRFHAAPDRILTVYRKMP